MLTIQILDGGETFYRQLDRHAVTFGASERADVQLREGDVAPLHARIEPIGDGPSAGYKIVDLGSAAGTIVNDEPVLQWRLELGDRVEIGRALLIVGQRRERPATATDVLDRSALQAPRSAPRSTVAPVVSRGRAPARAKVSPVMIGSIVIGLAACIALYIANAGKATPPATWGEVAMRARVGEFEAARSRLALLRRRWSDGNDERTARVDALEADVDALEDAVAQGRERLRREAEHDGKTKQIRALRAKHSAEPDSVEGRAARILLSNLEEIRRGVVARPQVADTEASTAPAVGAAADQGSRADASETPAPEAGLAQVRALCEAGDPLAALRAISTALVSCDEADAEVLRELQTQIDAELEGAASALIADARSLVASGRRDGRSRAIEMLREAAPRFPPTGGGGGLISAEVLRLRRTDEAEQASENVPSDLDLDIEIEEIFEAAERRERAGGYGSALALLRSIADREPERVAAATGMLAPLAAVEAHLVGMCRDSSVRLPLRDGGDVEIQLDAESNLRTAAGAAVPWSRLDPAALGTAMRKPKAPPPAAVMGAAVLAYRAGDAPLAERWLVPLVRQSATQAEASRVIADGRGDVIVDARGYRVVERSLVSVREIEQREAARRVEKRIGDALRRDAETRAAVLDEILAEDPALAGPVLYVLRQKLGEVVDAIEKDSYRKVWDKFAEQRAELDARRAHALELIFDRVKYFSPYKPPAVSAARYAEYRKVQDEIDRRVERVRQLWEAKATPRKPSAALARRLESARWICEVVADFGEDVSLARQRIAWTSTLPSSGGISLQTFCNDAEERRRLDEIEGIRAFNRANMKSLPRAEARQVEITNAYRELLGRAPLAFNAKLLDAARGHAEEMTRIGYFSHTSPTEGRRTPFQRMKKAGYSHGVAENIAKHPSAESAHYGWTHSSGHHRNLLMASHGEFAVGNDGNHWVQNFGSGREYRADPTFPQRD